ncbi:MAG: hypothetical protein FWH11_14000 [Micrococcales bacterium]|nr:hypothetical protein [Micrococcales bacterium]
MSGSRAGVEDHPGAEVGAGPVAQGAQSAQVAVFQALGALDLEGDHGAVEAFDGDVDLGTVVGAPG